MKKIFTFVFACSTLLAAHAQLASLSAQGELNPISRSSIPAKQYSPGNVLRSGETQIVLDYDSFESYWVNTNPDYNYVSYYWNLNAYNDTGNYFSLRSAAQSYDTLMDVFNNFMGYPLATTKIRVDSFSIILADTNISGQNDTFIVTLFDKSTAIDSEGFNGQLTVTPLWADTIIATPNFFPTPEGLGFLSYTFSPSVTLPLGHTFGIKVDFYGDTSDQLYLLASYGENCGLPETNYFADSNVVATHNSSFALNWGLASGWWDYNYNIQFINSNCPYFLIQNWLFYPYLTLNPPCPTITASASQSGSTTSATVSASGGTAPYTFLWSNSQTTDTATALAVDSTYTVTATDYSGCTSTATVTIACPTITVAAVQIGTSDTAYASTSGGTAPYTYSWNTTPAQSTDTVTGLSADSSYTVVVTDHNGCTGTATVSIITGIPSISGITSIRIYPNPSNGLFTLSVQLERASEVNISISDVTGRMIFESNDQVVKNITKPINLNDMSAGIYLVNVKTTQGSVNQRIVIR